MKNNKIMKVFVLFIGLLTLTSCTNYVREDKKTVINNNTGQNLVSNILCKPTSEDLYNVYLEHNDSLSTKLEELPSCQDFTPADGSYSSLWESLLIKPIAWLILKLGQLIGNFGISVMIMSLIIRTIMIPLSKKSMTQSENMKKAQPEIMKIEKKYANKTDNASIMAKSQETMLVYKKYNISPLSGCLVAFIQLPLFFAFLEAINRVPAIFEGELFNMNLGMTPIYGLQNGNYLYIVLIALIIISTYVSFKISMSSQANNSAGNEMKYMMMIMLFMISFASLSLPTAIALYWIVNSVFAIIQNIIVKNSNERRNIK